MKKRLGLMVVVGTLALASVSVFAVESMAVSTGQAVELTVPEIQEETVTTGCRGFGNKEECLNNGLCTNEGNCEQREDCGNRLQNGQGRGMGRGQGRGMRRGACSME